MRHPEFTCVHCGSGELRRSRSTSWLDLPRLALGKYPFRCLDCREKMWIDLFRKGKQARCPRCLTTDVVPSPSQKIRATFWQRQMLRMGARVYRCSFCGERFVTFKKRQHHHRSETHTESAPRPESEGRSEPARPMASAAGAGK